MNKQEAIKTIEGLDICINDWVVNISKSKSRIKILQEIIDAPEPKTGRVMSVDDLGKVFYQVCTSGVISTKHINATDDLPLRVSLGQAFHDRASCEKYIEYLKLEQELRVAQISDGFIKWNTGSSCISICNDEIILVNTLYYFQKIAFRGIAARNKFANEHTEEQLKLLIVGV